MRIIRIEMINSLEGLALNCIIKNFDAFMAVYNSTTNNFLLRCFEFLQRTSSRDLGKETVFECQFFPYLINPYIKKFNLNLGSIDTAEVIDKLRVAGNHVTTLDLRKIHGETDLVFLELIAMVPNIEELHVPLLLTESHLNCIGKYCPALHTLVAHSPFITMECLFGLCKKDERGQIQKNHQIRKLDLFHARIGVDELLFLLSYFPSLEELNHECIGVALTKVYHSYLLENAAASMPKFNLRKLDIEVEDSYLYLPREFDLQLQDRLPIKDVFEACSVLCPRLTCLSIEGNISQEDMQVCSDYLQLTEIQFCCRITYPTYVTTFLQLSGSLLVKIYLIGGVLSVELLSKYCPKLETLMLVMTQFEGLSDFALNSGIPFPHLNFLSVEELELNDISDRAVSALINSSPKLEFLQLRNFHLSNTFIASIQNSRCLGSMRKLDLTNSYPCFPSVIELARVTPCLEYLIMDRCDLTFEEYEKVLAFLRSRYCHIKVSNHELGLCNNLTYRDCLVNRSDTD